MSSSTMDQEASSGDITQQRTLSERLYDEVTGGEYDCPICTESISGDSPIWSCSKCHHIYHFRCVDQWSQAASLFGVWDCPTCKNPNKIRTLVASCWCGKTRHNVSHWGNSCGQICGNLQTCNSPAIKCRKRCLRLCHPGPCDSLVCALTCPGSTVGASPTFPAPTTTPLAAGPARSATAPTPGVTTTIPLPFRASTYPETTQTPSQSQATDEADTSVYRRRLASIENKHLNNVFYCVLLIVVICTLFLYLARVYAERTTRPMENKYWTQYGQQHSYQILVGLIFFHFGVVAPCTLLGLEATFKIASQMCNLPLHGGSRFVLGFFAIIIGIGLISAYPIVVFGVPGEYWSRQMRHTCDKFDARANLDESYDKRWKPLPDFKVFDPSQSKNVHYGENNFYLDDINILKANTTHALQDQPYNDFYRVSRRVAGGNQISVDFDLVAHTWRMTQTPFKSVVWSPEMNSMVPNLCDSALIKNGTWNQVSEASPHSRIPELNLQIPNYHYFLRRCKFQYFMKIFRTDNMSEDAILAQSDRAWTSSSESNVVMRTVSYGHSIQALEVCAKRKDYQAVNEMGDWIQGLGLGDNLIIPLGLLAVVRLDMEADGKRLSGDEQCVL